MHFSLVVLISYFSLGFGSHSSDSIGHVGGKFTQRKYDPAPFVSKIKEEEKKLINDSKFLEYKQLEESKKNLEEKFYTLVGNINGLTSLKSDQKNESMIRILNALIEEKKNSMEECKKEIDPINKKIKDLVKNSPQLVKLYRYKILLDEALQTSKIYDPAPFEMAIELEEKKLKDDPKLQKYKQLEESKKSYEDKLYASVSKINGLSRMKADPKKELMIFNHENDIEKEKKLISELEKGIKPINEKIEAFVKVNPLFVKLHNYKKLLDQVKRHVD